MAEQVTLSQTDGQRKRQATSVPFTHLDADDVTLLLHLWLVLAKSCTVL